jgi:hypothetical protein
MSVNCIEIDRGALIGPLFDVVSTQTSLFATLSHAAATRVAIYLGGGVESAAPHVGTGLATKYLPVAHSRRGGDRSQRILATFSVCE